MQSEFVLPGVYWKPGKALSPPGCQNNWNRNFSDQVSNYREGSKFRSIEGTELRQDCVAEP